MILALDAHALLWALLGDKGQLSATTLRTLGDPANDVLVSAATIWEIEIKRSAGRLEAPDDLIEKVVATRFDLLPIMGIDAIAAARLPFLHGNPFDRMLIAQAIRLDAVVVTRNRVFASYPINVLAA